MVSLVGSGMAKFEAYQSTGQSMVELLNQFPKTIQILFGMNGFDLTKASGFYGVLYMYIALMATIHAVLLGADLISKEERDKTAEFLYVKPISRARALTEKIVAGLLNILALNLVTFISSVYFVTSFAKGESVFGKVLLLNFGILFLQIIFYFFGVSIAGAIRKPKASASIAASVLMLSFFAMIIINFSDKLDYLKYLTPFKYFEAQSIMAKNGFEPICLALSLIIVSGSIFVAYNQYLKRDLTV
jgi:ABC-2 type transport system permease protein